MNIMFKCKTNPLATLSYTGSNFNEFNIKNLIKNVKPSYEYFISGYKIKNYKCDNIHLKVTEKIKNKIQWGSDTIHME
jgi:uncharacterized protein YeeX (DUF496 family)